ncbi:MAG: histidine kinase N-terminal 7TM domain-containing protein [bacterium]|nr:histidine kinase N-terminal 7TM domain-containing protein [bacterium]
MVATFYFLIIFLSVITSVLLTIYAWTQRKKIVGLLFFLTTASGTLVVVSNFAILISPTRDIAYTFARLQLFGTTFGATNILLFIIAYTGRTKWLRTRYIIPLYASALLHIVIIGTDPLHGWFYQSFHIITINNFTFIEVEFSWWFFVHSAFTTTIVAVCSVMLILSLRGTEGIIKRQYRGLLIGLLILVISAISTTILKNLGVEWIMLYNPYSISFVVFDLILMQILLREHFLYIIPIAHPLILSEIPEGVIITDQQGHILELNRIAQTLKGLHDEDEYIGKSVHVVFPELQSLKIGDVIATSQLGSVMYLEYQTKPLYRNKQPIGLLIMLRDVTRQRQFQQRELQLALEEERVVLLTKFIEKVSHEVRTPLAIIRNSVYLIERIDDVQKRAENLEQIKGQVPRINRLVDMMLKITYLESAKPTFAPIDIDLFLTGISSGWQAKPLVVYIPSGKLPIIHGDQSLLYEAIEELIKNASRFSPMDSTITISTSLTDTNLFIAITDMGEGIPADKLTHIFEMFWRNDLATNAGLGLGLPFVRQIAHLHGGEIDATSEVGKGSRFSIRLPLD